MNPILKMAYVFCILEDGTVLDDLPHDVLRSWLYKLYTHSYPVRGRWRNIPTKLLPKGIAVCIFNARQYIEEVIAPTLPRMPFVIGDRVRVCSAFRNNTLKGSIGRVKQVEHQPYCVRVELNEPRDGILRIDATADDFELMDTRPLLTKDWKEENPEEWERISSNAEHCPICLQTPQKWDGPCLGDVPTRCSHLLCENCWEMLPESKCPLCRDDISEWISSRQLCRDEFNASACLCT